MKRILALFSVLALVWPAQAHYVWLLPQKGMIQLIFSHSRTTDSRVPVTKIAQTEIFECGLESTGNEQKPDPSAIQSDPAAVKLLAEARAARAAWTNFPGFSADVEVNRNGKISNGKVEVTPLGKVRLKLEADDDLKSWVNREINSLVSHRMPGSDFDSPSAFVDDVEQHASGRAIRVLSDELRSSYRIRDKQIMEVNRQMKEVRFTISVLQNTSNQDKKFLPLFYVVNTWDAKTKTLLSSVAYQHTWTRIGSSDLPQTLHTVQAKAGQLDDRLLTFSNVKMAK